jgi:uncharacterized protein (DUF362 family)
LRFHHKQAGKEVIEMNDNRPRNLLLVALFIIVGLYTAYQENYSPLPWPFALVVIVGFVIFIWMALKVSTSRLLSLVVVIFIIEYIKETIGVRSGMWKYTHESYNFGIFAWVLAGMTVYWLAVRLVIPALRKLKKLYEQWNLINPNLVIVVLVLALIPLTIKGYRLSPEALWFGWIYWFWGLYAVLFVATLEAVKGRGFKELFGYRISPNVAILLLVIVVIPLTLGPYTHPQNPERLAWLWWSLAFYVVLLLVTLETANRMEFTVFLGLLLTTWVIAIISEYTGAIHNQIWTFPHNDKFPPLFLVIGFWPLEIFTQYRLSAVLAKEPLDQYTGSGGAEPDVSQAPLYMTREESHLRLFLQISAVTYLVTGLAFVFFPGPILELIDEFGKHFHLIPSLGEATWYIDAQFWLSLAFSMMMTITFLCFMAALNIRKNKGFIKALLVAKAASSLSSLGFILFHKPAYFASLVILLVDGSIFLITLYFFNRANRSLSKAQIAGAGGGKPPRPAKNGPTTVAAFKGDDKLALLDQVLETTHFFDLLNKRFQESGKSNKKDFKVVIKPNFMFMHSRHDISTYTDPGLVKYLVDRIYEKEFTNITLVEAQSTYGNYYKNRDVLSVARYVEYAVDKDGYAPDKKYRMVDLTEEMVPYDYGNIPGEQDPFGFCRKLGRHYVGPTWRHADFRISFAKNKTHCFCNYTLTLKNIYGTLPMQNKLKEYHTKRDYSWPTIASLTHFWVHFGLIDAFTSADGQLGVITCPEPKLTMTIIGGESLLAVDWVGACKMGLDPDDPLVGQFLPLAMATWGKPEINLVGDNSVYEPWENVDQSVVDSLDMIEKAYCFSTWWFGALTSMDPYFAFTWRGWAIKLMRWILAPFKRLFYEEIEI